VSAPAGRGVGRGPTMIRGASERLGVSRELARILVEAGKLLGVDPRGGEPIRNTVREDIDVGEYFVEAETSGGADVLECVANEDDARLGAALVAVEIDAAGLNFAGDAVFTDDARELGEAALEQETRLLEEFADPGIVDRAEGEEVGSHGARDFEEGEVVDAVGGGGGIVSDRLERERTGASGNDVESEGEALFLLNDAASEAKAGLQRAGESAGENDQARAQSGAALETDRRSVRARLDGFDARDAKLDVRGQTFPERVDECGIGDTELFGGDGLEYAAVESGVDFGDAGACGEQGFDQAELAKELQLSALNLLSFENRWAGGVGVEEENTISLLTEDCSGCDTGRAGAHDKNLGGVIE
jgi:hypothetical protein